MNSTNNVLDLESIYGSDEMHSSFDAFKINNNSSNSTKLAITTDTSVEISVDGKKVILPLYSAIINQQKVIAVLEHKIIALENNNRKLQDHIKKINSKLLDYQRSLDNKLDIY